MDLAALASSINTVWTLIAAFLVFFMQAGFAMLEAGLTRAKNAGNIILKNLMDFATASIIYFAVGFALMFGVSVSGLFGGTGFFLTDSFEHLGLGIPLLAFWLFQTVFAGTAATIVSGAMAERTKFGSYMLFSALLTALVYPVVGHWIWGGGWLANLGFLDFAGSTVVHSVGAWAALAGIAVLGPRLGRYDADGKPRTIPGHNLMLAALGVFILWFGWFGFNPGSTIAGTDPNIGRIAVTTNLGAAAGAMAALFSAWLVEGKASVTMALNGALAGLVSITAPTAFVSPLSSIIIGAVGGLLLYPATLLLDRFQLDDAVGAIPVHGAAGVWGTLAVGLFHETDGLFLGGGTQLLTVQAIGVVSVFLFTVTVSYVLFKLIASTVGLRVAPHEEHRGLDLEEHGVVAYPEFAAFSENAPATPEAGQGMRLNPASEQG